jgi:hypothetical protein
MAEVKEENAMPEGTPFCTVYMGADNRLRYSAKGVGIYTLIGWFTSLLSYLDGVSNGKPQS